VLGRSWWVGFNGIYLVRLDSKCGKYWFDMISTTENSNKFQKTRFWKEKSVENMVALERLSFNSNMISFHIWSFKKLIHTLQNNVQMFSNGFTLRPTTHATLHILMITNVFGDHRFDEPLQLVMFKNILLQCMYSCFI